MKVKCSVASVIFRYKRKLFNCCFIVLLYYCVLIVFNCYFRNKISLRNGWCYSYNYWSARRQNFICLLTSIMLIRVTIIAQSGSVVAEINGSEKLAEILAMKSILDENLDVVQAVKCRKVQVNLPATSRSQTVASFADQSLFNQFKFCRFWSYSSEWCHNLSLLFN